MVPEDLPVRELLLMLLGEDGRRRMENRTKTNDQPFGDYYILFLTNHSKRYLYEAKRILEKFHVFLGEFPPTINLKVEPNSRYCFAFIVILFFTWTQIIQQQLLSQ